MLQEQDISAKIKISDLDQIHTGHNSKPDRHLKESQLDFQKNYPKNIFIPMIEYLAQIGLKSEYEQSVGSREEFEGKNVVSLSLIHKLMGAEWFRQYAQNRVLISNISNKILMNSKIKKKLFHLFIVKNLFQVYDEDLKQFKKRISKLANSISEQQYSEDELFEFPSSILYLLRLFYKLICPNDINAQIKSKKDISLKTPAKIQPQDAPFDQIPRTPEQTSEIQQLSIDANQSTKQGSKQEYKFYIRKIIHHFNTDMLKKELADKQEMVQKAILEREQQVIQKYKLPSQVPGWNVFVQKVVQKCFETYNKNAKITHAMMNEWINGFKQFITTTKGYRSMDPETDRQKKRTRRNTPYNFKPLILHYYPTPY